MRLITALLASAFAFGATAGEAQLLPAGEFAARDGRPGPGQKWVVSDLQGSEIARHLNAIAAKTPIVIDYEHQTMLAEKNGQPAPAAGWMKSFEWRIGQGLFAQVEWTDRARTQITAGEYRYISPVITFDKASGRVAGVVNAALVNLPAIVGMAPVMTRLANQFTPDDQTETEMNLELLKKTLGLKPEATEADITAAIEALKARPAVPVALSTALGLAANADEQTAVAALTALKGTSEQSSASLASLTTQVATLSAAIVERDLAELLDGAIAAKKLAPAQRASMAEIGKKDMAWLKSHIATLQPIPGLQGQSGNEERTGAGSSNVDANDLARRATVYQAEQLKAGVQINTAQAVAAVAAGAK